MTLFIEILDKIDAFVWSPYLLIPLLLGTGIFVSFRLKFVQFRKLPSALRLGLIDRKEKVGGDGKGDISHFQALTTALSATVGTGNIAGVATAIAIGGPGALFWMWVTGLFGMATKYCESFLGAYFRKTDQNGEQHGGPSIYLREGIRGNFGKILAILFSVFATLASFGIGSTVQVNTVANSLKNTFNIPLIVSGVIITIVVGVVIVGGIKRIGTVTEKLVPSMIVFYLFFGSVVLVANANAIPSSLLLVIHDAFTGTSAIGGFTGSTVALGLKMGIARGLFSNESGMGSAAIVAAAAKSHHPVRQGLVSMTQTFIDTIIIVTFTGMLLITTGAWQNNTVEGANMTALAMTQSPLKDFGSIVISVSIIFFALSTVFGWAYYGERSITTLFGLKASLPYKIILSASCLAGALWSLEVVFTMADIFNGLMALPNLIGILLLSGLITKETKRYLDLDPKLKTPPSELSEYIVDPVKNL